MPKFKYLIRLTVIAFAFLYSTACKKTPHESRNVYFGNWSFNLHYHSFTMNDGVLFDYLETYDGKIEYGKDMASLIIKYAHDKQTDLVVDEDGQLSGFSSHYSSGSFTDPYTLDLFLRWGGLGGGTSHTIKGIKKR